MNIPNFAWSYQAGSGRASSESQVGSYLVRDDSANPPEKRVRNDVSKLNHLSYHMIVQFVNSPLPKIGSTFYLYVLFFLITLYICRVNQEI